MPDRDEKGRFASGNRFAIQPGETRNPHGARGYASRLRRARAALPDDAEAALMQNLWTLAFGARKEALRAFCTTELLNRLMGKPIQGHVVAELMAKESLRDGETSRTLILEVRESNQAPSFEDALEGRTDIDLRTLADQVAAGEDGDELDAEGLERLERAMEDDDD